MSDRFLHWANRALDNQFVGQRLLLCRKAAEALCKIICVESFPDNVGKNLSRMIDFLQSKKMLNNHVKAHLDVIRIYCNLESHDNELSSEVALPAAMGALSEIKKWYESDYEPYPDYLREIKAREEKARKAITPEFYERDIPNLILLGESPFSVDNEAGFFARLEIVFFDPRSLTYTWSFGHYDLWFVFGKDDIPLRTLKLIKYPLKKELGNEYFEVNDPKLNDMNIKLIKCYRADGYPIFGLKNADGHLQEFIIEPLQPFEDFAWNIVVMGQEACLQYLFEKNLRITQEDVFNHPLHSKHPAVTKYKTL
jgi:hypothetical protein